MHTGPSKTINRAAESQSTSAAHAVALAAPVSVQRATRVSSPGEPAEAEAEATADRVMHMPAPSPATPAGDGIPARGGPGAFASRPRPSLSRFADSALHRTTRADQESRAREAEPREERGTKAPLLARIADDRPPLERAAAEDHAATRRASTDDKPPLARAAADEKKPPLANEKKPPLARAAADEKKPPLARASTDDKPVLARVADDKALARAAADDGRPQARPAAELNAPVQRSADGAPNVKSSVMAEIASARSGGRPLPLSVRRFMEPRFGADFGQVRIHDDDRAARLNQEVRARAFTHGQDIFFGRGQFRPDSRDGQRLVAHELTHTIQQGGSAQRLPSSETQSAAPGASVQRAVAVHQSSPVSVQRLGLSDALDYFARHANIIPGFRLFTMVIGFNPINMQSVERSGANLLRGLFELMPGGGLISQALDNHGVFERAAAWIGDQIASLSRIGASIRQAINRFLDSLSWTDIFDLGGVWERAKNIFTSPIQQIRTFAAGVVNDLIQLIKDAILRPIARLAEGTDGYALLKAVLGRDPITGDPVPRTAENIIGPFMRMIGQEEIWENIQRANAIPRAWAWFQGALAGAIAIVSQIPTLFVDAFRALQISDILQLPTAFAKIVGIFAGFGARFISWAGSTIWSLLEIIFEVVAPGAMPVLRRAAGAFRTILRNPIGFVGNLVRAGIRGFEQFATNFLTHLKASLIGWLTGAMGGAAVYIPQSLAPKELLKFALSVMGITWGNVRKKLVKAIGEPGVLLLEGTFSLVKTLVTDGPAAAWQQILRTLGDLKTMVLDQVMEFVKSKIVTAAVTKLVSFLNPAGAFIQAILAIYNTVMFFVERLQQIAQVATAFINAVADIAAGTLGPAAAAVERTMAGLLTLVISFLARIAGLGKVSDMVVNVIKKIQAKVDQAIDSLVTWIVKTAKSLLNRAAQAGTPTDPIARRDAGLAAAVAAVNRLPGNAVGKRLITPVLAVVRLRYGFSSLEAVPDGGYWTIEGSMSPPKREKANKLVGTEVNKIYATYTKENKDGVKYAGRTSGEGNTEGAARDAVRQRDYGHHMNDKGFGEAQLDSWSTSYDAIRLREQQLINEYGRAKSDDDGRAGNARREISKRNMLRNKDRWDAAKAEQEKAHREGKGFTPLKTQDTI